METTRREKRVIRIERGSLIYLVSLNESLDIHEVKQLYDNSRYVIILFENDDTVTYGDGKSKNIVEINNYSDIANGILWTFEQGKIPVVCLGNSIEEEIRENYEEFILQFSKVHVLTDRELIEQEVRIV